MTQYDEQIIEIMLSQSKYTYNPFAVTTKAQENKT